MYKASTVPHPSPPKLTPERLHGRGSIAAIRLGTRQCFRRPLGLGATLVIMPMAPAGSHGP